MTISGAAESEEVQSEEEKKGAGGEVPEPPPAGSPGVVHWNHHVSLIERGRVHWHRVAVCAMCQ